MNERCGPHDGLSPGFSWADQLEARVEPRWAEVKERGNAALKAGKLDEAIALYQGAFAITQQPFPQLLALEAIAEEHPKSPLAKFATATGPTATPLMLPLLSPFLPKPLLRDAEQELMPGLVLKRMHPNRPAAICMANIAAARMKRDAGDAGEENGKSDLRQALDDASAAAKLCPEYVKAHSRTAAIMLRLARTPNVAEEEREDLQKRAQEKKRQVADFNELVGMLPWNGPALEQVGWIDHLQYSFLYEEARFLEVTKSLRRAAGEHTREAKGGARRRGEEGADGGRREGIWSVIRDRFMGGGSTIPISKMTMNAGISLVGKDGGQCAVFNISYADANFNRGKVDALHYEMVDNTGEEQLEKSEPPHGRATKRALENTVNLAAKWLDELQHPEPTEEEPRPRGFRIGTLVIGQGLVGFKKKFSDDLNRICREKGVRPPLVHAATSKKSTTTRER
jgi:tetratricopeptide (TPR) repeat protein